LTPQYRATQEETLHFRFLRSENGGPLQVARDWVEHAEQLAASLEGARTPDLTTEAFVQAFVRPQGLDQTASDTLVKAIETAASRPPAAPAPAAGLARQAVVRSMKRVAMVEMRRTAGCDRPGPGRRLVHRVLRHERPRTLATEQVAPRLHRVAERLTLAAHHQERLLRNEPPLSVTRRPRPEDELERALATGAPVFAGPWTGSIGLELLVWIPFLRWACERYPELPARLFVASRGNAQDLYADIASEYFDLSLVLEAPRGALLSLITADDLADDGLLRTVSPFSEPLMRLATVRARELILPRPAIFDPSVVVEQYALARKRGDRSLLSGTPGIASEATSAPDGPVLIFREFSDSFAASPANDAFFDEVAERLALSRSVRIVTLRANGDHAPHGVVAEAVACIRSASAVVAPRGGLSTLAGALGRPTVAVTDGAQTREPIAAELEANARETTWAPCREARTDGDYGEALDWLLDHAGDLRSRTRL
jgi:hypothetical protein